MKKIKLKNQWCFLLLFFLIMLFRFSSSSFAQKPNDTTEISRTDQYLFTLSITYFPCPYDSSEWCIIKDILSKQKLNIFYFADSISGALNIPPGLIYEIGMNESRWPNPDNLNHLIKDGDLQVVAKTFHHFYNKLGLTGGITRVNYLIVACHYLIFCYEKTGSWQKARFMYGRGHWREPSTWTPLEKRFMTKIDWSKYDPVEPEKTFDEEPQTIKIDN